MVLAPCRVRPPTQEFSWSGPGSGRDAIAGLTDPLDEVRYGEACDVGYPERKYRPHATFTNYYADSLVGNDTWDGSSPTFTSGTTGPKKTWKAAYDAIPAAGSGQINLVNLTQAAGVEWNEGEYINIGGTKTVVTVPYYLNVGRVIFDGRAPAASFTWTQETDAQGTRWYATYTCGHTPALNEGQANVQSTSVNFANQGARFATDIDGALASLPVTRLGVWIRPAVSLAINTLTRVGTLATCTTVDDHNLATGDSVTIYYVDPDAYNGVFTVTVTGAKTFTYTMASDPGASGSDAGNNPDGMRWVSKRQVADNTFYHANPTGGAEQRLYVGFDPTGQEVRAATLQGLFSWVNGSTHVMMGCVVRYYATRYGGGSNIWTAMCTHSCALVYENNFFGFTSAGACGNGNTNAKVYRDNHFAWCLTGSSATTSTTNLLYWRSFGRFFNWQQGGIVGWHCGLHKSANVTGVSYVECQVEFSQGPGLWLDYASGDNEVINNRVHYCANFGISIEKNENTSGSTIVAGNLVTDCLWGIGCTGSTGEEVVCNTVVRCGVGFRIFDDLRDPTHNIASIILSHNIIVACPNSVMHGQYDKALIAQNDGPAGGTDSSLWYTLLDYNVLHVEPGITLANSDVQHDDGSTGSVNYTVPNWIAAYPTLNANGAYSTNQGDHPLIDPAGGDFRRAPVAAGVGAVLSAAHATALGPAYGRASAVNPGPGARWAPGLLATPQSLRKTWTGADSATVPGAADTGQAGTAHAGNHGISGNKGYSSTDADGDVWTVDGGTRNGWYGLTVEGTLNSVTNFRVPRFVFAGLDADDYLTFEVFNNQAILRKRVAGVFTQLDSAAFTTANGTQYRLRVKKDGATLVCYVDLTEVFTHPLAAVNSAFLVGTRVGYHLAKSGAPGTNARVDNLWVSRL